MAPDTIVTTGGTVLHLSPREPLYIGIDIAKKTHVAGFVSAATLRAHKHFEKCPSMNVSNSRDGFSALLDRMRSYAPLDRCTVLMEMTGHYHRPMEDFLTEAGVTVYVMHVTKRPHGMIKSDKRDALGLANTLYNQVEKGIQVADRAHQIRRAFPPTDAALKLRGLMRHRYELSQEITRRKNKLTAINDQLFTEFTDVFKDPNLPTALAMRRAYPTPQSLAAADLDVLCSLRPGGRPSRTDLGRSQHLATDTIGVHDPLRQDGLVFEQALLIDELRLATAHLEELDARAADIVAASREGQIVRSMPHIGAVGPATIIAAIGDIRNFPSAGHLKSYFGWAPSGVQTGTSIDSSRLTRGGLRPMKQQMYLIVGRAIRDEDCEWSKIYARLLPRIGSLDERTGKYRGVGKVKGRIAGQMVAMIYAFLKADQEAGTCISHGEPVPEPMRYDQAIHAAHRKGQYHSMVSQARANTDTIIALDRRRVEKG